MVLFAEQSLSRKCICLWGSLQGPLPHPVYELFYGSGVLICQGRAQTLIDTLIPPLPPYLPAVCRMNAISPRLSVSTGLSVMARQLMVSSQLMYWGGTPCEVSSATRNKHAVGISNISVNTTTTLTSQFFFLKTHAPLVFPLFLFTACSLSVITSVVSFYLFSSDAILEKENRYSNIYSCRYVASPQPPLLCDTQIGLRESSYSITNRPPTRPLTTSTFFYGREKWTSLMFRHK